MTLFSERYGYTNPSNVIIRKEITVGIQNAICNCYDELEERLGSYYFNLQEYIWTSHFNLRKDKFQENISIQTSMCLLIHLKTLILSGLISLI